MESEQQASSVAERGTREAVLPIANSTFDSFIRQTVARSAFDTGKAAIRRQRIEARLAATTIPAGSWFESGSFNHGTAVRGYSDVDYMVRMGGNRPSGSGYLLDRLRQEIPPASSEIVGVRRSAPTVQVHFVSDPDFEIVPTYYAFERNANSIYYIPDTSGAWVESAPRAHLNYVNAANEKNGKTKSLVRLVKQWKYTRAVPVSSFYLEMRVAAYLRNDEVVIYDYDFPSVLRAMRNAELRSMNDPTGSVSRIPACSSETNRLEALSKIDSALTTFEAAKASMGSGRATDAWVRLVRLFGDDFPYPQHD